MEKINRAVVPLRVLLVLLFAGLVVAQVLIMPGSVAYRAEQDPNFAHLEWPFLAFSIIELLCVQVVIVCTWRLLSMVKADEIFSDAAFAWVDVIIWTIATAWVLFAGVFVYIGVIADDPGVPVLMFGMLLVGGVIALLMVVMRALLRRATILRADMESVI